MPKLTTIAILLLVFVKTLQSSRYRHRQDTSDTHQYIQTPSYNNDQRNIYNQSNAEISTMWMKGPENHTEYSWTGGTVPNMSTRNKVVRDANSSRSTLVSQNCSHGICDTVKDYPTQRIANLINKSRDLRQYFEGNVPVVPVHNRFGEDDEMCRTNTHWRFPQSAKNTKNEERLLVNDETFKQGVFYETCVNEGAPCMYQDLFPDGYVTTCIQKYSTRRLMTYLNEPDKTDFDNFQMPSCCVCTIKKPNKK